MSCRQLYLGAKFYGVVFFPAASEAMLAHDVLSILQGLSICKLITITSDLGNVSVPKKERKFEHRLMKPVFIQL